MKFQSKLPDLELTIFSVMTQLAIEHSAINLSQGFPDFDTYPELISLVEKYMSEGHNQYAPMQPMIKSSIPFSLGVPSFRLSFLVFKP